jgi:hypothetical protein
MIKRFTLATLFGGTLVLVAASRGVSSPKALIAHEWGTFTTVAGADGRATAWLPLDGPTDLPCFVEHFQNQRLFKIIPGAEAPIPYADARSRLTAKVRMETPVIYFYGPRAQDVNVTVRFPRGWMTEWYPHAVVSQPYVTRATLAAPNHTSVIVWNNVHLAPAANEFPVGLGDSHYYAARNTEATPLRVGTQSEKFLFYRGVADFDVPLQAVPMSNGGVHLTNTGEPLSGVVLFERRGDTMGFRVLESLGAQAEIRAPELNADMRQLRAELERQLTRAGLYGREANAMLDTWRDSWFEEGLRLIYIVPRGNVDAILPLTVVPAPESVARVFVARMEIVTPRDLQVVDRAVAAGDSLAMRPYGRFLGAIADRLLAAKPNAEKADRIRHVTDAALATYVRRADRCE